MTIFDIIVFLLLGWALYRGFRDGVAVQLGGLAGLFIGVYFAFRFGPVLGRWLKIDPDYASIVGFIIVLILVIIGVAIIGRLLRGLFSLAGLQLLDKLGGIVLSLLKAGLILGLFLYVFDQVNRQTKWVPKKTIEKTIMYKPLIDIATFSFPYMDMVKDKLFNDAPARRDPGPTTAAR